MLAPFPIFGTGNEGKSTPVSAQRRVNLYAEYDMDSGTLKYYPTPGLVTFANFGANAPRGIYRRGESLFVVHTTNLWEVSSVGVTTFRGTLNPVSGKVDMVDNGEGDQLLIVDGQFGYIYDFSTLTLTQIADADFVAGDTCDFLNGRFIVGQTDSPRFSLSAVYDGTSWDALDYATAESSPGNLVRVKVNGGTICLFKESTVEFWGDSGASDFPFARVGAGAMQWGLAARWSVCDFMDSIAFLRRNDAGALQVCMLSGYSSVPLSNPELDHLLSTYTNPQNATALSYTVSGHPMYQINFPNDDVSWCYDALTKEWHQAQYGDGNRHRAEMSASIGSTIYVCDYQVGKVYRLDHDTYTDDGQYIVRELVSRHLRTGSFSKLAQLWMETEAGVGLVGTVQGSDPQVMLQVSRDGGQTWGNELWRGLGRIGEYLARAVWNRLGRSRVWTFKFRVTDPVKVVFIGAWARYGE